MNICGIKHMSFVIKLNKNSINIRFIRINLFTFAAEFTCTPNFIVNNKDSTNLSIVMLSLSHLLIINYFYK